MKLHWSRVGSTAPKFIIVNLIIGGVFAMLYAYVYKGVIRGLVKKNMNDDKTITPLLAKTVNKYPEIADILSQERNALQTRTPIDNIIRPILPADPETILSDYQQRSFIFWYLNSLQVQAGMGAVTRSHGSPAQRAIELVQVIIVLFVNAFVIAST